MLPSSSGGHGASPMQARLPILCAAAGEAKVRSRPIASTGCVVAAVWAMVCIGMPNSGNGAAQKALRADASVLVSEVRRAFTVRGKAIPPEIFRDMGDGDLADSESIWVTADLEAAIGSNLYADAISKEKGWLVQAKPGQGGNPGEVTAYKFIGSTENGLLIVIATYNGGGTGIFHTLHILDVAAARAFDSEGKPYRRLNLTCIRSVPLGDRWDGDVTIAKNSVHVITNRKSPGNREARETMTISARRPNVAP